MGSLSMSAKERRRLEVLSRVKAGGLTLAKAAELLGVSRRQVYRVYARWRRDGDAGLVHGLRGKASNRKVRDATRAAVPELYREKYADFGPTLAAEKLAADDGHEVNRQTLRRMLRAAGLWAGRRRRKPHRSRRERRACLGEMAQMDGSDHDWFEGRGPRCVLMVLVDDATGRAFCRFYEAETTRAAFDVFGAHCRRHGVPRALYVDRDSIYRCDRQATVEEELRAASPLTQFGRAMKLLGVELILANSPQAKGRVERCNGTLQDRLVKELRLAGVSDIGSANAFLERTFLPAFNRRFAVEPREAADLHVPLSAALGAVGKGARLDEVLCWEEPRVVLNDWCVCWRTRVLQLSERHEALGLAGRKATVREKLDGSVQLLSNGHKLRWKELARRPARAAAAKVPVRNNKRYVPPPEHPWKRGAAARASSPTAPQPAPRHKANGGG
jgi:transposase